MDCQGSTVDEKAQTRQKFENGRESRRNEGTYGSA
jgi:hypothetical protein